jgi:hypothetical protein
MPTLTRWFLKTALVYLIIALLTGALLAGRAIWALPPLVLALTPVYFHMFMVGWVTQLIFGVVFWMFPKYSKEQPRGHERLGWTVYGLLNLGLALRVVSEPVNTILPGSFWGWLLLTAAVLQWLAGVGFIVNTWPRVSAIKKRG